MLIPLRYRSAHIPLFTVNRQFQHKFSTVHNNNNNVIKKIDLTSTRVIDIYNLDPNTQSELKPSKPTTLKTQLRDWSTYQLPHINALYRTNTIPIVGGRTAWLKLLNKSHKSKRKHTTVDIDKIDIQRILHNTQDTICLLRQLYHTETTKVAQTKLWTYYKQYRQLIDTHKVGLQGICGISKYVMLYCYKHNSKDSYNACKYVLDFVDTHKEQIKQQNVVQLYSILIMTAIDANKYKTAIKLIQRLNATYNIHSSSVYIPLIEHATKSKDTNIVLSLLDEMINNTTLSLNTSVLNAIIRALIQCETDRDEVFDSTLLSSNDSSTQVTNTPSLHSSVDRLMTIFDTHDIQPNGDTIKYILSSSYCDNTQHIQHITQFVKRYNLQYNPVVAEQTVLAYLRLNELDLAISYLQTLQPPTIQHPLKTSYVDRSYNIRHTVELIDNPIERQQTVQQLKADVLNKRYSVESVPHIGATAYNFVLQYCAQHDKLQHAMNVWTLMNIQRYTPSVNAMCAIMCSAGRCNSPELLWQIFNTQLNVANNNIYTTKMYSALTYGTVRLQETQYIDITVQLLLDSSKPRLQQHHLIQSIPTISVWRYLVHQLVQHQQFDLLITTLQSIQLDDSILIAALKPVNNMIHANRLVTSLLQLLYHKQHPVNDNVTTAIHAMYTRCAQKSGTVLDIENEFTAPGYNAFLQLFNVNVDAVKQYKSAAAVRQAVIQQLIDQFNQTLKPSDTDFSQLFHHIKVAS